MKPAREVPVLVHLAEDARPRSPALGCALFLGAALVGLVVGAVFGGKGLALGPLIAASFVPGALWLLDARFSSTPWRAHQGVIHPDGVLLVARLNEERSWPAGGYTPTGRVTEGERTLWFLEYAGARGAVLDLFGSPSPAVLEAFPERMPRGATLFARTGGGSWQRATVAIGAAALSAWWLVYAASDNFGRIAWLSLIMWPVHLLWTLAAVVIVLAGKSRLVPCRVDEAGLSGEDWVIRRDDVRGMTIGPGTVMIEHGVKGTAFRRLTLRLAGGSLSPWLQARLLTAALSNRHTTDRDGSSGPTRIQRVPGKAPAETDP